VKRCSCSPGSRSERAPPPSKATDRATQKATAKAASSGHGRMIPAEARKPLRGRSETAPECASPDGVL
jgi:hypothetical protein